MPLTLDEVTNAPTQDTAMSLAGMNFTRNYKTICSIWPQPLRATRRHNGVTNYVIPAAPRGKYVLYKVFDTFERILRISNDTGDREFQPGFVPSAVVAECLVTSWADQLLGQSQRASSGEAATARGGIMIIAGDKPTEEELFQIQSQQESLARWYVKNGNDFNQQGKQTEITNIHRMMAEWLHGNAAKRLPWFHEQEMADIKSCPKCGEAINGSALSCRFCQIDLIAFYQKYTHIKVEVKDPVVAAFIREMAEAQGGEVATTGVIPPPPPKSKEPRLAT